MKFTLYLLVLLLGFAPPVQSQESSTTRQPFPASTAEAEQVSPAALKKLDQLVQSLADDNEIVGAELLVIKNGRSILHEAYGWRNRDAELKMETGSVFCVRSMTKPLIGTSILMLIEEGLLKFEDPISKYMPEFDVEGSRDITIEHLLTHTSGLPMSLIMAKNLKEIDGIRDVAKLGGGQKLEFKPGSNFNYSDQGTDTLTALIEVVTGTTAADFVQTRLLDPLGMNESATVMTEDHPLRIRGCSKYTGSRGSWTEFWNPEKEQLFPFFLGSQGLYSTLTDYARFTDLWLHQGRIGTDQVLDPRFVQKALTASPYPLGSPTGLPGLRADYGSLMQLWTGPTTNGKDGEREVIAFGHTGSDGTHAWVFPKENAMVFYFTQSRGTISGLQVESALGELFFGVAVAEKQTAPPLEQYLGYYWEHDDDAYRAIIRDGEELALEVPGKAVVPLTYIGEDRWQLPDPSIVMIFDRSQSGDVTGFAIGDNRNYRFDPSPELPTVNEISALVTKTHRLDRLESLGPMRIDGNLVFTKLGMEGSESATYAWPNKFRFDTEIGPEFEHSAFDGNTGTYHSRLKPAGVLEGLQAQQLRLGNHWARFGDWKQWHTTMVPIQQLVRGGKSLLLLRAGDTSSASPTLFIDLDSGRILGEDNIVFLEGMGRLGQRTRYFDFRDVSGMLLPYETKVRMANPMIGTVVSTVTEISLGVEVKDGRFDLRKD